MKKIAMVVGALVAVLAVAVLGFLGWASSKATAQMARSGTAHSIDFPVPAPLSEAEAAALAPPDGGPAPDLKAVAMARAVANGQHLVESRYACIECHGKNFAGGVMLDDPAVGTFKGPNLTGGKGSRIASFAISDWDRAVRHGVLPGGRLSAMPSEDYRLMSDRELSDIIAYVRTFPAVDNEVPPVTLGPIGKVLVATGQLPFSYDKIESHDAAHLAAPPEATVSADFGKHLAAVCTGCHRMNLEGGPIPFGPPDWAPSANLTPHEQGLKKWTFEQFKVATREGRRPDGSPMKVPMNQMRSYFEKMTDVELEALWVYLQKLEPRPTGT